MENKKFRNALVNAMKAEIVQFANEQRAQKKTRKLENRPKGKSLGDIVEEINIRAYKIRILLHNYRWIKHGLKYWANRGVQSYKYYYNYPINNEDWFVKHWDNVIEYGTNKGKTHGDVIIRNAMNYYKKKCEEYNIECPEVYLYTIITKYINDNNMEEKKFYGPKPSYVFLKQELKGKNNEYTSFYYHGINLVYYCIKHDLNEEHVNEYLDKEISKCKKYLNNNCPCIFHSIPYHIYKDIINTSKNDFKLNIRKQYKYDWETHTHTNEIEEIGWYDWINQSIKYAADNNRYKTFFRQCSEHSIALDDLFKRRGYCNCEIRLNKIYRNNGNDTVLVIFRIDCDCGSEKDFKKACLNYWHFIKLLDYVSEEDKNDIDIDELYSRKEFSNIYDTTQQEVKHNKGFDKSQTKTGVWGLVKGVLTKLYDK